MRRTLQLTLALLLVFPVLAQQAKSPQQASGTIPARPASGQAAVSITPSQIFSRARPSVVIIVATSQKDQSKALGSGFVVNRNRIVTNHHVLEDMNEAYAVFSDGEVKPISKVVADSTQQDLVILTTETGNRPSLTFGDELSLQQGDPVYALGAPKGLELSFTNGIVSSFRKSNGEFLIQTTAPIAPGSSGGPLFDRLGHVVGVTTSMISDAPGIYFSVGVGDVKRLLRAAQGVALPLEEWAKQQGDRQSSESSNGNTPRQSQDGQGGSPSLKDTLSWMETFTAADGFERVEGGKLASKNVLRHPDTDAKEFTCVVVINHDYLGIPSGTAGEVASQSVWLALNQIDINHIAVKAADYGSGTYEVDLDTFNSANLWEMHVWFTNRKEMNFHSSEEILYFLSEESAKRFATAIKHAATLCGAKASSF